MPDDRALRHRLWQLSVASRVEGRAATLLLHGRLSHANAPGLATEARRLVELGLTDLTLDLADVDYISSAALRIVETLGGDLSGRGGRLMLANPSTPARLALELAGIPLS